MPQAIDTYKVVRRGQKYCVRVRGVLNWCKERNMSYHVKRRFNVGYTWDSEGLYRSRWDYDFIFDEKKEALTFILGYL
jgi:hypothetical protein